MEKVIKNGFVEKVFYMEVEFSGKVGFSRFEERRVWYILYYGVYYLKKFIKIWVVFDCSAEY